MKYPILLFLLTAQMNSVWSQKYINERPPFQYCHIIDSLIENAHKEGVDTICYLITETNGEPYTYFFSLHLDKIMIRRINEKGGLSKPQEVISMFYKDIDEKRLALQYTELDKGQFLLGALICNYGDDDTFVFYSLKETFIIAAGNKKTGNHQIYKLKKSKSTKRAVFISKIKIELSAVKGW